MVAEARATPTPEPRGQTVFDALNSDENYLHEEFTPGGTAIGVTEAEVSRDPRVLGTFRDHDAELAKCSAQLVERGYASAVYVGLMIFLGSDGKVENALLRDSSGGDGEGARCVVEAVGTWRFPGGIGRTAVEHRIDVHARAGG